ncbi:MAG: hypothetical protein M3P11_11400 [Actinomycetota bacterium]|nr:hypothetical protein [Actinomycetota bacterium]
MTDRVDPLLEMVAKTATITDRELAGLSLDTQQDRVFEQIVSSPTPEPTDRDARRGAPRLVFRPATAILTAGGVALLLIAVVAVLVIGQPIVSPTQAKAAGIHFARQASYIDATIDDPSAPAASMEAAFAEHGLDITVNLTPASPGLVGTITFMDNSSFEPIYGPEGSCLLPGGGTRCVIGIRVPSDFSGSWEIEVNGTPAPGQAYESTEDALSPGEVLHCSGVRGMTVSQAAPILEKLGVTVIWPEGVSQASVGNQFIAGTDPVSQGTVSLSVQPEPPSRSDYYDELNRGC